MEFRREKALIKLLCYAIRVFSEDEAFCITSYENKLQVWNLIKKKQEANLEGNSYTIETVAISNCNSFVVSGSSDSTIRVWNLHDEQQEAAVLQGHASSVNCIAITRNEKLLVSGSGSLSSKDNTIRIWSFLKKRQEAILESYQCIYNKK